MRETSFELPAGVTLAMQHICMTTKALVLAIASAALLFSGQITQQPIPVSDTAVFGILSRHILQHDARLRSATDQVARASILNYYGATVADWSELVQIASNYVAPALSVPGRSGRATSAAPAAATLEGNQTKARLAVARRAIADRISTRSQSRIAELLLEIRRNTSGARITYVN